MQEYDGSAESEMIHLEMNVDDDDDADSGRSAMHSKYHSHKCKFPIELSWKCQERLLA